MATKVEVVSTDTIKPSSPTPPHLRNFKFCLLDQLAPPFYVPIVLFYSAPDDKAAPNPALVTGYLKTSLTQALSLFYPLGRRVKGNAGVDCNDEGALFLEAKDHFGASTNIEEQVIVGVQANFFDCGGIGIGICISHKIADGSAVTAFLNTWSEIANNGVDGAANLITPFLKASELFQPKDINFQMPPGVISREKLSTKRFRFNSESLACLTARFGGANPTCVEAMTTLIWKSAVEAVRKRPERKEKFYLSSAVTRGEHQKQDEATTIA
ncbi:vinorine synthase-like [Syzygium oleosum]|uniref:vinorine synthase-like n=1 Tax=Syzygium oleosum TaxID=219896 RepID=UPI0011D1DF97|nr:vinorine synthase-like [Syzygium oleosum]